MQRCLRALCWPASRSSRPAAAAVPAGLPADIKLMLQTFVVGGTVAAETPDSTEAFVEVTPGDAADACAGFDFTVVRSFSSPAQLFFK